MKDAIFRSSSTKRILIRKIHYLSILYKLLFLNALGVLFVAGILKKLNSSLCYRKRVCGLTSERGSGLLWAGGRF